MANLNLHTLMFCELCEKTVTGRKQSTITAPKNMQILKRVENMDLSILTLPIEITVCQKAQQHTKKDKNMNVSL